MYAFVEEIVRHAGSVALSYFDGAALDIEEKGSLDLVTVADKSVERQLVTDLSRYFPDDGIVGEEGTSLRPNASRKWIIDPIDGTFNYVRGMPDWAISIGLVENGVPIFGAVYAPVRNHLLIGGRSGGAFFNGAALPALKPFVASQGVVSLGFATDVPPEREAETIRRIIGDCRLSYRNIGSTAVALMHLACGQVDAVLGLGAKAWDIAGGLAVGSALGGQSTFSFIDHRPGDGINYLFGKAEVVALASRMIDLPSRNAA